MEIIYADKNEKEFISIAEKLRIKEIYFVYPYKKEIKDLRERLKGLQAGTKIKIKLALEAETKDISKAKQKSEFVIYKSTEKDQQVIEKLKPNLVYGLEGQERKDPTHYRRSGMNQVIAKLAHKNKVIVGVSFSELLNAKPERKVILLGRIRQNLKICKKYKVETVFASFSKNPYVMRMNYLSLKRILI